MRYSSIRYNALMESLVCLVVLVMLSIASFAQIFEVESGTLTGVQFSNQRTGFSGTGYVTGFDADGDNAIVSVNAEKGLYDLYVRYASPDGEKFNFIYVNGQSLGSIPFTQSDSFRETKVGKVFLQQGINTISFVKEWGYYDLDNIRLEPSKAFSYNNISKYLVTPSPSKEAENLYAFLSSAYGKVILSGQYGGRKELDRITEVTGRLPAIWGFDLMDYSPSRVAFGASSKETSNAIDWHKKGGIVTFCWHWNAPKDLINISGKEWWRGFYTSATNFDVAKAMNDPASEEFRLIIQNIDAIAVQLKKLKDSNVPVL